ncbi:hypothetical protein [Pseudodesulfovibrio senegalensis]|nr:hypothetical protein [Pseudodesulfovibrio senegalensis]
MAQRMRTLSPRKPDFMPFCHGDANTRDSAYHLGMVGHGWPDTSVMPC